MARAITVVLAGDAKGALNALGRTEGGLKKFAKVAGAAALAGGAVATALGVKGVQAAVRLETGLSEVRTLLPDLTDKGFADLRKEVLAFSDDMGVATDEAVPALYQAISAGVPRDNVIDFMRTATAAAVGGVTDLETAVDGITSVVNAYGADVISAAEASDLMFTAVKLGTSAVVQLSSSLFNVTPLAAAAGIEFGHITAGLARLTAQGTPTSVATTQLRAAIQALIAPGRMGKKLMDELGLSFDKARLEEIGLEGALNELYDATGGNIEQLKKIIGSVEGVQAVLGLTGPNADAFSAAIDEMAGSAGATDKAFETMSDTLAFKWGKVTNRVSNMLTRLGIRIMPLVEAAVDAIIPVLEGFGSVIDNTIIPALRGFGRWVRLVGEDVLWLIEDFSWQKLADSIKPVLAVFLGWERARQVTDVLIAGLQWLTDMVQAHVLPAFRALGDWFVATGLPKLREFATALGGGIATAFQALVGFVGENVEVFKALGIALGVAAGVFVTITAAVKAYTIATTLLTAAKAALGVVIAVLTSPITLLVAAIAGLTLGVIWLYKNNESFRAFVDDELVPTLKRFGAWFVEEAVPAILGFAQQIGEFIVTLASFRDFWSAMFDVVKAVAKFAIMFVAEEFKFLFRAIKGVFELVGAIFRGDWKGALTALRDIGSAYLDMVVNKVKLVGQLIVDVFAAFGVDLPALWRGALTKVLETFRFFRTRIEAGWRAMTGWLKRTWKALGDSLSGAWRTAWNAIYTAVTNVGNRIVGAIQGFVNRAMAPIQALIDLIKSIPSVPSVGGLIGKIPGFAEGGVVPGPTGAPQLAVVHGGEEVLTPRQRAMRGGPTVTIHMHIDATGGDPDRIGDVLFPALESLARRGFRVEGLSGA